jgi:hypothetical protein
MEWTRAMRQAGVIRAIGLSAAALWLGSAAMVTVPRTVHAQDDSTVSTGNSAPNESGNADDNDAFGTDAAVANPDATPLTLTGSWTGIANDNQHGSGTVDIDFTTQVKKTVQGTWSAEYGDSTGLGGSAVGKVNGKSLSLIMDDATVSRKCRIKFSGKITADDGVPEEIKGKYSLTGCFKKKSKGTFDLTPAP